MNKRIVVFLLMLTCVGVRSLFAGTTGKIAGIIRDAETREALPGANVTIEGTTLGDATDLDGNFAVIGVPPGNYTVVVTMMGYKRHRVQDVGVRVDLTTPLDVNLQVTVLEAGEEVTVVAERPIVQMDMTSSLSSVAAREIEALPAESVSEVLSLQAGVVNAGGIHIRGGRANEVAYWVDGVVATDVYNGGNTSRIENTAIEELQVISGTFNAEYGQAMSGIVNIITKDGGQAYNGELTSYVGDYVSGDKMYGVMKSVKNYLDPVTEELLSQETDEEYPLKSFNPVYNLQGSLSGPVPFTSDRLTFFANARYYKNEGYLYGRDWFKPQGIPGDSALIPMNGSQSLTGLGKLALKLSNSMKLTYSLNASDSHSPRSYSEAYKYVPEGRNQSFGTTLTHLLSFNHVLSGKTFYEVKLNRMSNESQSYLYEDENARPNWLVSYQAPLDTTGVNFETIRFDPDLDPSRLDSVKYYDYSYNWIPDPNNYEGYVHADSSQDPTGYSYKRAGTDLGRSWRKTSYWIGKLDLTSQFNQKNQLKAGFEVRLHELELDSYTLISDVNPVDGVQIVPFKPAVPNVGSPSRSIYTTPRKPREISAYIQDKIELKDLIMNLGVRFDYFDANHVVPADPEDINIYNPFKYEHIYKEFDESIAASLQPQEFEAYIAGLEEYTVDERREFMHKKTEPKMQISPRLGIAYPITDRGVIHFSYGHFFQMPTFQYLYARPDFIMSGGGGQTIIGNAELNAQRTTQYEIGLQQQIGASMGIDVTLFYRDIRDWVGTSAPIATYRSGVLYSPYENRDYANTRGITFKMEQRFTRSFSFQMDYSWMVAEGTYSNPDDAFNAINAEEEPQKTLVPMNWDQRHTLNAQLIYRWRGWTASMVGVYRSGLPYTPSFARGAFVGGAQLSGLPENSSRRPTIYYADFRLDKEWRLQNGLRLGVFTYIDNLFDVRAITNVYSDTGAPDYTTNPILTTIMYDERRVSTPVDFFTHPTWYISPRLIRLGLRIGF
ncbi:TonB-dependent receptor [candidate division KSB1 bacterium]|nr:TonB-dependent receptor [candidate division KSB1 bacterium]